MVVVLNINVSRVGVKHLWWLVLVGLGRRDSTSHSRSVPTAFDDYDVLVTTSVDDPSDRVPQGQVAQHEPMLDMRDF